MKKMTAFTVQINGGQVHEIMTMTSQYGLAAFAALAMLDYVSHPEYDVVKIWVPDLIPHYGPYFYGFDGNVTVRPSKDREF